MNFFNKYRPYTIIAIVPPKEQEMYLRILQRAWNKKYVAHEKDNTPEALRYPPHITLKSLGEIEKKYKEMPMPEAKSI